MFKEFLTELRQRRVLRTAVGYAIAAAALVEFTDIVTPALNLPAGLIRAVIIVALVGFPIVILLSWFFDFTSDGVVRGNVSTEPSTGGKSQVISIMLIAVLVIAVSYLSYRLYWESPNRPNFERGKSIAVLPFTNISQQAEADTAYFSEGMAEEILNGLSKVEGLRVASRTSSFAFHQYKTVQEVGEALNVSVVLEGSVQRRGDQLRISVQMVDTSSGFQFWSRVEDEEFEDVFLVQEKIAHSVVKALRLKLLGNPLVTPGTESTQAYDKYLEARNMLQARTPSSAYQAIEVFKEALNIDPNYAQAYAGLADGWILLREVGDLTLLEATLPAHDAITKALQIDNALPEAQAALGICMLGGGAKSQARIQFQKAIDLDPEYADAYLLQANLLRDQGYLSEATTVYNRALSLDPLNSVIVEDQALLAAYQGRFERASELIAFIEERNPGRPATSLVAAQIWAMAGDNVKALEYAKIAAELAPASPLALAAVVDCNARLGFLDEARSALDLLLETAPNNETAVRTTQSFYLMTGDYEALNSLADARVAPFLNRPDSVGPSFLFDRVGWAALAQLALGDFQAALALFEKGFPDSYLPDPSPAAARILALWAKTKALSSDAEGAAKLIADATQVIENARAEGWDEGQLQYATASVAAAAGSPAQALSHIRSAIDAGWNDFVFIDHDPLMAEVVQLPEFLEISN